MAKAKKGGLGKGLDALFIDNDTTEGNELIMLRLSEIEPNREQPRNHFDESALAELADSIRQHGVLQPLTVRPLPTGGYQIVAGERRWRASRMAGLAEVPALVRDMSDLQAMEIALIENLQRQDLNAMEEAYGYQLLMNRFDLTQDEVAEKVGKSRPAIANTLRLLNLPETVAEKVRMGQISSGHARILLGIEDTEQLEQLAKQVEKGELSVRELEKLVKSQKDDKKKGKGFQLVPYQDPYYQEAQLALAQELGRKVEITPARGGKGKMMLEFYDKDDLIALVGQLAKKLT